MTLEQQRALALARARLRAQQAGDEPDEAPSGVPGPRRQYDLAEVPIYAGVNAGGSAAKFAGGVLQAVTSPVETLRGILDVGAGALRNALPASVVAFVDKFDSNPEAARRAVQAANAVGGVYKDRYGDYESIKRTFAEDPVGAIADLSSLLSGAGSVTGTAARLGGAGLAKAGAAQAGANLAQAGGAVGAGLSEAGSVINPLRPVQAAVNLMGKGAAHVHNVLDPKSAAYLTAAEGRGQEILNALRAPSEIVPGSRPTAAEAASSVGATRFSAMGESARATPGMSTPFFEREQANKAALLDAIRQIGKTPEELANAIKQRETTAKRLYGIADEALLPGRERQFRSVKIGETAGGEPRINPLLTGEPVMTPVPANNVIEKTVGQGNIQRVAHVEVGRDSFNQPIFETRPVSVSEPSRTLVKDRDSLTNTPILTPSLTTGGVPIYKQVLDGYKYEPQLAKLMERPAIRSAFDSAATIAGNKGVAMFTDEGKLTGQGAHLVKLALDDAISPTPGTPIAKNTANAIKSAKAEYLTWLETKVPEYKTARETFAKESKPINQMEIGQYLEKKLEPVLGEETAKLRAQGFATAVENAPLTIKKATGESRYANLSEALTPEQLKIVKDVEADLARSMRTSLQASAGRGGGPNVNLMGTETIGTVRAPNLINVWATVTNDLLRRTQGKLDRKLALKLAGEMLDPYLAATSLEKAIIRQASQEKALTAINSASAQMLKYPSTINTLAPVRESQNALTVE